MMRAKQIKYMKDKKRIEILFPKETYEAVMAKAKRENTSFAEQVRTMVEWGLENE